MHLVDMLDSIDLPRWRCLPNLELVPSFLVLLNEVFFLAEVGMILHHQLHLHYLHLQLLYQLSSTSPASSSLVPSSPASLSTGKRFKMPMRLVSSEDPDYAVLERIDVQGLGRGPTDKVRRRSDGKASILSTYQTHMLINAPRSWLAERLSVRQIQILVLKPHSMRLASGLFWEMNVKELHDSRTIGLGIQTP